MYHLYRHSSPQALPRSALALPPTMPETNSERFAYLIQHSLDDWQARQELERHVLNKPSLDLLQRIRQLQIDYFCQPRRLEDNNNNNEDENVNFDIRPGMLVGNNEYLDLLCHSFATEQEQIAKALTTTTRYRGQLSSLSIPLNLPFLASNTLADWTTFLTHSPSLGQLSLEPLTSSHQDYMTKVHDLVRIFKSVSRNPNHGGGGVVQKLRLAHVKVKDDDDDDDDTNRDALSRISKLIQRLSVTKIELEYCSLNITRAMLRGLRTSITLKKLVVTFPKEETNQCQWQGHYRVLQELIDALVALIQNSTSLKVLHLTGLPLLHLNVFRAAVKANRSIQDVYLQVCALPALPPVVQSNDHDDALSSDVDSSVICCCPNAKTRAVRGKHPLPSGQKHVSCHAPDSHTQMINPEASSNGWTTGLRHVSLCDDWSCTSEPWEMLLGSASQLEILQLHGSYKLVDMEAQIMFGTLLHNTTLCHLHVSLQSPSLDALEMCAQVLRTHPTLKSLRLRVCAGPTDSTCILSRGIETCRLQHLSLAGIPMDGHSAETLFSAIQGCSTITSVYLQGVALTDLLCPLLGNFIQKCRLTKFVMPDPISLGQWSNESWKSMLKALSCNTSLVYPCCDSFQRDGHRQAVETLVARNRMHCLLGQEHPNNGQAMIALWPHALFRQTPSDIFRQVSTLMVSYFDKRKEPVPAGGYTKLL